MSILIDLTENNDIANIKRWIKLNLDLDMVGTRGWTALMIAAYYNYKEIAFMLIDAGCNLDSLREYSISALMHACWNGNHKIAIRLIEAGCDLNIKNFHGETALMIACEYNQKKIVFKLIEAGCDLEIKDEFMLTEEMKLVIKKAIERRNFLKTLMGKTVKLVQDNPKKFNTEHIRCLPKDIRKQFTKN